VLFTVSVATIVTSVHELPTDTGSWLDTDAGRYKSAIGPMPLAGLFLAASGVGQRQRAWQAPV
jgi:hypothetical protein